MDSAWSRAFGPPAPDSREGLVHGRGVDEGAADGVDPIGGRGLWLGGGVAYFTVALNVLVLAFGGREGLRDVAGVVFLANLPVIVLEAVAMGFVVAYLHRSKPEWLTPGG